MILRELSFLFVLVPARGSVFISSDITESYWHALVHPGWHGAPERELNLFPHDFSKHML